MKLKFWQKKKNNNKKRIIRLGNRLYCEKCKSLYKQSIINRIIGFSYSLLASLGIIFLIVLILYIVYPNVIFGGLESISNFNNNIMTIRASSEEFDPTIRQLAFNLTWNETTEYSKMLILNDFVFSNISYMSEIHEYIQKPTETLALGFGDCDDRAILLASLGRAIGIPCFVNTGWVGTGNHAFTICEINNRQFIFDSNNIQRVK